MKYIVLLRGINISGKNKISMPELKKQLIELGYNNVVTVLNSGNILLESDENKIVIRDTIHNMINNIFNLDIPVFLIEYDEVKDILNHAPLWWNSEDKNQYDNLIFIIDDNANNISKLIGPVTENLENIEIYKNVIFWTFDLKLHSKCNWWKKTASIGIGEKLTIRTANTMHKLIQKGK